MTRLVGMALAVGVLLTLGATLQAQETKNRKPLGTWEKTLGDAKIKFEFKAEEMQVTIASNDATIQVFADYGVTKDGFVYGVITKTDKKGTNDGPAEGELFGFRVKVTGDKLEISDLKGPDSAEARQLVQGQYKKAGK